MQVEEQVQRLFGSLCRARETAAGVEHALRTALCDLEHCPSSRPAPRPFSSLFSDADSGYMSQQADDTKPTLEDSAPAHEAPAHEPPHLADSHNHDFAPTSKSHEQSTANKRRGSVDQDAQTLVISSLRSQVADLISQVTALNGKLVKSYDRVSDLEDEIHVSSQSLRTSSVKVSQLELERTQHLAALDTGLLVEKEQVTAELTRLMEKATEEAAQRGQAESARMAIEQDLDDLSAGLFGQANTMVAEARFARAQSERKAEDAERALRETEEVVQLLQQQMQELQEDKENSEQRMQEMSALMGKGKYVERTPSPAPAYTLRLYSSHIPYHEFLGLLTHLRALRPASPQPPAISSLLGLPFIARLQLEDTDPTVRLDIAPALNWLTRRSVITAIQHGQLSIEPSSTVAFLESSALISPGSSHNNIVCALCGVTVYSNPNQLDSPSRQGFSLARTNSAWSTSIFKNPLSQNSSAPPSPPPYQTQLTQQPSHIYIFRVANPITTVNLPQSPGVQKPPTSYPLCTSNWCLARLRSTCSLWSFVRTGVVEKIWEEDHGATLPPPRREVSGGIGRPPVPPRRGSKMGGLWGVASALGVSSWAEGNRPTKEPLKDVKRFVAPPPSVTRTDSPARDTPSPAAPPALSPQPHAAQSPHRPPPLPTRSRSRAAPPAHHPSREGTPEPAHTQKDHPTMPDIAAPQARRQIASPGELDAHAQEHEAFATPSEGPSLSVTQSRATSPATIPLPESKPVTPAVNTVALPVETDAPAPPEPTDSPSSEVKPDSVESVQSHDSADMEEPKHAPAEEATSSSRPHTPAAVNAVQKDEHGPSRAASPSAPPIPRRAAGRRPVPVPPPHPQSATHPAADAHNEAPAAPTPDNDTVELHPNPEHASDKPEKEATAEAQPEVKPEEHHSEPRPPARRAIPPPPPRHRPVVVESHPETEDASTDSAPQKAETAEAQPEAKVAEEHPEPRIPARRSMPPPPPRHPPVVKEEPKEEKSEASPPFEDESIYSVEKEKPEEARVSQDSAPLSIVKKGNNGINGVHGGSTESLGTSPDGAPYVSDATWEERTWKELVRLREEMFWARIGAQR
ncbi:hypothetical protein FA95DRAFT_1604614 [Auriscalpium vulgare]|uniref:Uncharacterized protein n=1 Tax=Auriscalpium vulgare TaxID=40419 RepID=A0ACB8RYD0_9AGAM|nr:hypothetical protein FA95DRAFT_1604614 [Auriscalpium vulgare]